MPGGVRRLKRFAFTLVELLVVIAIVGILMAITLPAIQSSRETGRKAACLNSIKQASIAVLHYEQAKNSLPTGSYSCCWGSWIVEILPYIEEAGLSRAYDHTNKYSADTSYRYSGARNTPVTRQRIALLLCPADDSTLDSALSGYVGITKHSYVVNGGNTGYTPRDSYTTNAPVPTLNGEVFGGAPFSNEGGAAFKPLFVKTANIRDGLSHTLMISETVIGDANDTRGFSWWGFGALFSTYLPPNASQPDVTQNAIYCGDPANALIAPCAGGYSTTSPMMSAARSRHTGGIQTSFCDGSARFISDEIDLTTWRGLGTSRGGETLNLSSL